MKTLRAVYSYRASEARLFSILTTPEVLVERQLQQGARAARVRERREDRLTFEVEADEYPRSLTGVDHSRTERAQVTYVWEGQKRCRFDYHGPQGERVQIGGWIELRPVPSGVEVVTEVEVSVRVPLLGGLIERRIAEEIEAGFPSFDALIRRRLEPSA